MRIKSNHIFPHKIMRINYDTYDMRRDQDCINPDSHPDIMMIAPDGAAHPFYYARTVAILHVYALLTKGPLITLQWQELHVCYVRWFEVDTPAIKPRRLIPLRWAHKGEEQFGFVSPDDVLRGCHLIPGFAHGRSDDTLRGYSGIRFEEDEDNCDWNRHYVNQYVCFAHTYNVTDLLIHPPGLSTATCLCGTWAGRQVTCADTPRLLPALRAWTQTRNLQVRPKIPLQRNAALCRMPHGHNPPKNRSKTKLMTGMLLRTRPRSSSMRTSSRLAKTDLMMTSCRTP